MFSFLKSWNRKRILRNHRISNDIWLPVIRQVRAAAHLELSEIDRLQDMASLFLYEKSIEPAHDLVITNAMRTRIACEAAIPILNLGLDYYRAWYSVIVYPEAFIARDVYQDEAGVLHTQPSTRSGEAWSHGPVIISWQDVLSNSAGSNVIIHEMAHKLDMLDGVANGRPPMQFGMDQEQWTVAFSEAFAGHTAQVDAGLMTEIDSYAATSPAEFFAVTSEVFFETPRVLQTVWPEVYAQLVLYYRQRP
jgi:MtfA peptidase